MVTRRPAGSVKALELDMQGGARGVKFGWQVWRPGWFGWALALALARDRLGPRWRLRAARRQAKRSPARAGEAQAGADGEACRQEVEPGQEPGFMDHPGAAILTGMLHRHEQAGASQVETAKEPKGDRHNRDKQRSDTKERVHGAGSLRRRTGFAIVEIPRHASGHTRGCSPTVDRPWLLVDRRRRARPGDPAARQTGRQADRQTGGQADRRTGGQAAGWPDDEMTR